MQGKVVRVVKGCCGRGAGTASRVDLDLDLEGNVAASTDSELRMRVCARD